MILTIQKFEMQVHPMLNVPIDTMFKVYDSQFSISTKYDCIIACDNQIVAVGNGQGNYCTTTCTYMQSYEKLQAAVNELIARCDALQSELANYNIAELDSTFGNLEFACIIPALPEPFATAFQQGASIDFKAIGNDHEYLEKNGHTLRFNDDCSYSTDIVGYSPSSYGNWGTIYSNCANILVANMLATGIIKCWRIRMYTSKCPYSYDDATKTWQKYSADAKQWLECECPL